MLCCVVVFCVIGDSISKNNVTRSRCVLMVVGCSGGAPKEPNAKRQEEERRKREGGEEENRCRRRLLAEVLRIQVSPRQYLKGSQAFIDMHG